MNSAKKIMKNGGENATQSTVKQSRGLSKNMILILVGIILVAVLGGGVCYVNLRPRAILTVEGKDADGKTVTHTINSPGVYHASCDGHLRSDSLFEDDG